MATIAFPDVAPGDLERIEDVRRRRDPAQHALLGAHVTFVFPSSRDREPFVRHVSAVAAVTAPIPFVLRTARVLPGVARERFHVALVPDEGYDAMVALHDRLYTSPLAPALRHDLPFVPHMTVASAPDRPTCNHIARELNASGLAITGTLEALDVVSVTDAAVRTVCRAPLNG